MIDPSQALAGFRIPSDLLIAMDNRDLHFALQPYHFIIRAVHVLAMAAFFGGIVVLDLRLMGLRAAASRSRVERYCGSAGASNPVSAKMR